MVFLLRTIWVTMVLKFPKLEHLGEVMEAFRYIHVFVRVAQLGSFTKAGEQLGLAKSAISKQITTLEAKLGSQLFNRSTRKLALTEAGETYFHYCKKIVDLEQEAETALKDYQSKPTGMVRIASDQTSGRLFLTPIISRLQGLYPDLKIELLLEDRIVNIIEENIDLSVRVGWLQDSNLIARKLFESRLAIFASPGYLEKHGVPTHPRDLLLHQWVALSLMPSPLTWTFQHQQKKETVHLSSKVSTNSVDALLELVKKGCGITALAEHVILEELKKGELISLLQKYELPKIGVYAVYPNKNNLPLKTQVVLQQLYDDTQVFRQ